MSSTMPVWLSTVTRSLSRTGCVNASMTPEPRLPSGVVRASPAMTARTALDARNALATERPANRTSADHHDDGGPAAQHPTKVRASAARPREIALGEPPLPAVE